MAGATGPAVIGGPPGPKKPGLMAWAKKHKTAAAAGAGGVGLVALYLLKKGRANAAADTTDSTDLTSATTQGSGGLPATFDGGSGSDDSASFQALSDQLSGISQQLSGSTQGQNPPPANGVNFYQLAKAALVKGGNKNPSKKQIDAERRKLLTLFNAPKGKLISEKIPPVHKPTPTRKRK